jgi:protein subunit release factor A
MNTSQKALFTETTMETVIIEVRAAEGGEDAKLLVTDQVRAYANAAARRGL